MGKNNFKNKYIKNVNPLGVSIMVLLYIFMTCGIHLSTYSMTSKQDLIVNGHHNIFMYIIMTVLTLIFYLHLTVTIFICKNFKININKNMILINHLK